MQREFWNDIGRTSRDGVTSTILSPTPQAAEGKTSEQTEVPRREAAVGTTDPSESIASVADFPASLFQWREIAKGTVMSVGCGRSFAKLWKHCDRGWSWLRTSQGYCQRTLDGYLELWSETWPRSGSIRNGVAYRLEPLVSRISGGESSLLPTARASDSTHGGPNQRDSSGRPALSMAVQFLPTPQARDHFPAHSQEYIDKKRAEGHGMSNLNDAVMLPTPTANDFKSGTGYEHGDKNQTPQLRHLSGGLLNPQFVEAMMGLPIGWTELDVSATQLCRKSPSGSENKS